ncbi:MAG: NADH-quinone oxidoreductase subunit J [Pseudomonadota bacterium]
MFLADISFYLFSAVLLASALVVVSTKNTIYSVMFLILAFFNAAGLFVLLGAEFLAMLLVIVYVGAIAVLFLFVVMMLNIDAQPKIKKSFNKYLPLVILIAGILFIEIFILTQSSAIFFGSTPTSLPTPNDISNTKAIGNVLYTNFIYPFQLAGMVLFVAMIGAIVLTLRDQDRFIKKQNISEQVSRTKSDSVKLVKVETGQGINV